MTEKYKFSLFRYIGAWIRNKTTERNLPKFSDLMGIAPDITGDEMSEDFVRRIRGEWDKDEKESITEFSIGQLRSDAAQDNWNSPFWLTSVGYLLKDYDRLKAELAQLKEATRWIPDGGELPESDRTYKQSKYVPILYLSKMGPVYQNVGWYDFTYKTWHFVTDGVSLSEVGGTFIAWYDVPSPPEDK